MNKPRQDVARRIIDTLGANGIPPQFGFQYFTAGLDPYLGVIEDEYLNSFIRQGGSAFKMVVGVYGGGKTHFLYSIRDLAWKHNFVVSYVSLSARESPFHKLELVYRAIARGLVPPLSPDELLSGFELGITSFLRSWFAQESMRLSRTGLKAEELKSALIEYVDQIEAIESISFLRAVRAAFKALIDKRDDDFINICQWLSGEGYDRRIHSPYGIYQKIDKTTAFSLVRSLAQWVKRIGFSGLVVLLDEAERVPSLTSREREQHLSNLREVIDECGNTAFQSVMIFYAVPDENFLEGRTQVYEALKQRLTMVFEELNPSGVKVTLEKTVSDPVSFLKEVGTKIGKVYETAYSHDLKTKALAATVELAATLAYEERFGDIGYKRLFVQRLVRGLHYLHQKGEAPSIADLK